MRRLLLAFALLAVSIFVASAAGSVPADPPVPLPPQAAERMMNTPDPEKRAEHLGGAAHGPRFADKKQISPFDVPGLGKTKAAKFRLMGYACWFVDGMRTGWGTYPYDRTVEEHRYWCGYFEGGAQTYRSSSVHIWGTLCNAYDAAEQRISGGNGYNWTSVRTAGSFSCQTNIPWWTLHSRHWQDWHCDTYTWTPCRRIDNSG